MKLIIRECLASQTVSLGSAAIILMGETWTSFADIPSFKSSNFSYGRDGVRFPILDRNQVTVPGRSRID
jgi:hypothetical protein